MIEVIKLWVFVALWAWVILLWRWEWTCKVLGYKKVVVKNPNRPWWKLPEQKWVEHVPSVLDAAWFALAWPLLLFSFVVYGAIRIIHEIFN